MKVGGAAYAKAQTDDPANRETHDFYPTWPGATRALLSVEKFVGPIWEPACGDGAMSKVLEAAQDEPVYSTDLIDRGYGQGGRDFLMEWEPLAPNIITNPPFRWAREFVDRALLLTTPAPRWGAEWPIEASEYPPGYFGERSTYKVALFMRLAFLEGQKRGDWFPQTPLARIWIMSRRVPLQRGRLATEDDSGGIIAFAWYVWDHSHNGPPTVGWLDWKDGK